MTNWKMLRLFVHFLLWVSTRMLKNHIHYYLFDVKDRPNNNEEKAKRFTLIIRHPLTSICMTRKFNHTPIN